jgi:hypothetical protein
MAAESRPAGTTRDEEDALTGGNAVREEGPTAVSPAVERGGRVALTIAYVALALLCLLFVTGMVATTDGVGAVSAVGPTLPWQVYAFTVAGAVTHVLVSVARTPNASTRRLATLGLRIPVALVLTWALYGVLTTAGGFDVGPGATGVRNAAAFALGVGLFVDHAIGAAETIAKAVVLRVVGPPGAEALRRLGFRVRE